MAGGDGLAGRHYARVYAVDPRRGDLYEFLRQAVRRSGGELLYDSSPEPPLRAPVFLGVQVGDERLGMLVYAFRCNPRGIRGRAADEHRVQIRYGGERSWHAGPHPLGRDVAGVDATLVLGVHLDADLLIGLDPLTYDPLPMGISVEFKDQDVQAARASGWHVWERENRPGRARATPRSPDRLEAVIALRPERLLDYARFERQAQTLGLDPPLRQRAAEAAASRPPEPAATRHALERQFDLTSQEILEIIAKRKRLNVALRGGVAEHHLERQLRDDTAVDAVSLIEQDGEPDFDVQLVEGRQIRIECKNASPQRYKTGDCRVEVQKTRATQGDPAGRLYRLDQFDVVAACLYPPTGEWAFRFKPAKALVRDARFPDRLAPLQRVDHSWSDDLAGAVGQLGA